MQIPLLILSLEVLKNPVFKMWFDAVFSWPTESEVVVELNLCSSRFYYTEPVAKNE